MIKPASRPLKLPRELELTWLKALVKFGKNQREAHLLDHDELKRLAMRAASLSMPTIGNFYAGTFGTSKKSPRRKRKNPRLYRRLSPGKPI
jgi:hypothetical protein